MNEKLKKLIFYKLYENLKHVEVIPYKENIWFIDREQKCWYFVYEKNNKHLWWYYHYFCNYFNCFSLERSDAEYVMSRWVEEVLNSMVNTTGFNYHRTTSQMEEVLNSMVDTTDENNGPHSDWVRDVLNSRVDNTRFVKANLDFHVEEVLSSTVDTTEFGPVAAEDLMEKVLKSTNHE